MKPDYPSLPKILLVPSTIIGVAPGGGGALGIWEFIATNIQFEDLTNVEQQV